MDYKQKYNEALERAEEIIRYYKEHNRGDETSIEDLEQIFPELKASENERVRKEIISALKFANHEGVYDKHITWLEKQGESNKPLYIRFGDIPSDEKSKIYRNEEEIGIEEGVSVYPAFETNGDIVIGLSLPITRTTLHTQQHLLEYENRPCYLVTGDYVGKGSDGEPLIKNVRIIKEIKPYRMKQDKENNCGISVYNEELKDSEDERIRKDIIRVLKGEISYTSKEENEKYIAWMEKQGTKEVDPRYENLEELLIADNIYQMSMNDAMMEEAKSKAVNALSELGISKLLNIEKQGEPKFKVGDWICNDVCIAHIASIKYGTYYFDEGNALSTVFTDKYYHLWTINDAEDGDVISNGEMIVIFKHFEEPSYRQHIVAYIGLDTIGNIQITDDTWNLGIDNAKPATKEQRELLFKRMKEEGYEWDAEKKEIIL